MPILINLVIMKVGVFRSTYSNSIGNDTIVSSNFLTVSVLFFLTCFVPAKCLECVASLGFLGLHFPLLHD